MPQVATPNGNMNIQKTVSEVVQDMKESTMAKKMDERIGSKGKGNCKYTYNMIENPEPLAEINQDAASTFRSEMYNVIILDSDTILFRSGKAGGGKNALGQYFKRGPSTLME